MAIEGLGGDGRTRRRGEKEGGEREDERRKMRSIGKEVEVKESFEERYERETRVKERAD